MARQNIKINVVMKNGYACADSDSAYQTIKQLANCVSFPTALAIKRGGTVIVCRYR